MVHKRKERIKERYKDREGCENRFDLMDVMIMMIDN